MIGLWDVENSLWIKELLVGRARLEEITEVSLKGTPLCGLSLLLSFLPSFLEARSFFGHHPTMIFLFTMAENSWS